jgi:hypothetical protein
MTHATVSKAKGYPRGRNPGEEMATEERRPGYYALVPFALIGDTATLPAQGIWALVVWPLLPEDVRERWTSK